MNFNCIRDDLNPPWNTETSLSYTLHKELYYGLRENLVVMLFDNIDMSLYQELFYGMRRDLVNMCYNRIDMPLYAEIGRLIYSIDEEVKDTLTHEITKSTT